MAITASYLEAHLIYSLADLVLSYFSIDTTYEAARTGLWEQCAAQPVRMTSSLLAGALDGEHSELVEYLLRRRADTWGSTLADGCANNWLSLIKLAIANGASEINDFNNGMRVACLHGHLDIVELMIARGANDSVTGMYFACKGGHYSIIRRMLDYTHTGDWNWALACACTYGNEDTVRFAIANGANDWNRGLPGACQFDRHANIRLMITHGANECSKCFRSMADHLADADNNRLGK